MIAGGISRRSPRFTPLDQWDGAGGAGFFADQGVKAQAVQQANMPIGIFR